MSTRSSEDFRTRTYNETLETPIDQSEEHLRDHREEHVDSWEVKRSPELLMNMYHNKLVENDPVLAKELVAASEGKLNFKDASWLDPDTDRHPGYPMGSKAGTVFASNQEALNYVTNGDREQAAIILGILHDQTGRRGHRSRRQPHNP